MSESFYLPNGVGLSSQDETWKTPGYIYRSLDEEFHFTLDGAALKSSTLCPIWYGPDHDDPEMRDALVRDWHKDTDGAIYLNPPYGRGIGKWMEKANLEAKLGATVVCLIPARTDTSWWWDYCVPYEIRFIRGRLKFNEGKKDAPFPSAIIVISQKTFGHPTEWIGAYRATS